MPALDDPIAFSLGGVSIRWYALFILGGILTAVMLTRWLARRRGLNGDFILDIAPWVVFGAIVGARFYYVLLRWDFFAANPDQAFNLRLGGLTIHGALAAGVAVLAFFCWRARQRFFVWADLIIAGVPLGQAIGRWGNWANQEAFGRPTSLPWAVTIDPANRPAGYGQFAQFHPTFLYESLLDLAIAAVLSWLVLRQPRSRILREGDVLWTYFILYGIARLLIERMRTDSLYIGPLPAAYWASGGLIVLGAAMLLVRHTIWPAPRVADLDAPVRDDLLQGASEPDPRTASGV
jgi:phosphatidylglycerol:prolipoprotein diacylglycerol transferase